MFTSEFGLGAFTNAGTIAASRCLAATSTRECSSSSAIASAATASARRLPEIPSTARDPATTTPRPQYSAVM